MTVPWDHIWPVLSFEAKSLVQCRSLQAAQHPHSKQLLKNMFLGKKEKIFQELYTITLLEDTNSELV